jgi:ribose 1,5-bisphosphokinase
MNAGEQRLGPGCLVLVVGPSGAGKDTLLAIAATRLAARKRIVFGRRIVTRVADGFEDHDSLTSDAFDVAQARGDFALAWRAHGHGYGVPYDAARRVEAGDTIVFNVSRAMIDAARKLFARVRMVYVTAPPEILARRLEARGRDGDIVSRLARAEDEALRLDADLLIENIGDRNVNAGILAEFLTKTLA